MQRYLAQGCLVGENEQALADWADDTSDFLALDVEETSFSIDDARGRIIQRASLEYAPRRCRGGE